MHELKPVSVRGIYRVPIVKMYMRRLKTKSRAQGTPAVGRTNASLTPDGNVYSLNNNNNNKWSI